RHAPYEPRSCLPPGVFFGTVPRAPSSTCPLSETLDSGSVKRLFKNACRIMSSPPGRVKPVRSERHRSVHVATLGGLASGRRETPKRPAGRRPGGAWCAVPGRSGRALRDDGSAKVQERPARRHWLDGCLG